MKFLCLLLLTVGVHGGDWGYGSDDGPDTWVSLGYDTCGASTQSPIDLVPTDFTTDFGPLIFSTNWWDDLDGEIFNNGHTVEFEASDPTALTVTGGPFGNETYNFIQLHFHWGSDDTQGSEHTVGGHQYPLEMHMVCINSKYVNSDGTKDDAYGTEADGVAVLGFLFDVQSTTEFETLENVMSSIEELTASSDQFEEELEIHLNLGGFLDQVVGSAGAGYFTYFGSFTTPGCNEVVTWLNFAGIIQISAEQIAQFRTLENDWDNGELSNNYRPVQDLNGRAITRFPLPPPRP